MSSGSGKKLLDNSGQNSDTIEPESRHFAVQEFFGTHRKAWLDRYASTTFDARNYRRRADVALGFLGSLPRNTGRLLEIGCGAGVQSAAAERLGWRVAATDITVPLLAQAREEFQGPQWVAATAEDLPFAAGTFDVVLMLGVIGYVSDPNKVLQNARAMLSPNGYLIISWARANTLMESVSRTVSAIPDRMYLSLKRAITRHTGNGTADDQSFYHAFNRFWNRDDFSALLSNAGFVPIQMRGVNFGQFRFMDRAIWPERVDAGISSMLERLSTAPGLERLGHFTRTHIALARKI